MNKELSKEESEFIDTFLKEYLDKYQTESVFKGKVTFLMKESGINPLRNDFILKELYSLSILSFKHESGHKKLAIDFNRDNIVELIKNGGMTEKWLNREQKKINISLSENTLKEFPKTKWFARIGFFIAVVLGLKELYFWIMQLQAQ
ncbi:hypothetical protein [Winogradskyella immobilis]|uniref:Uncharacterized protein n=1 Tax=Winogradskyella immobilis TaxID=2816852 RepID=A0ABS8EQT0_9FLAO|nr:hypothetical protein [Winogradskyella immobilis]MCC1485575.1 hypothetical protein [Winogradskyella immobilis]MCG0017667.1 hypothetical protein [Winogradskyella immobilis]